MRNLIMELEGHIGSEVLVEEFYDKAKAMLDKGIMPDGERWKDGKPPIQVGMLGVVKVSNLKKVGKDKHQTWTFTLKMSPGKPGGGGVTIPAAASNHFFNLAGLERNVLSGAKKAFQEKVKGSTAKINKGLMAWFRKPGNWVWRLTGWKDREMWQPTVKGVKFSNIKVGKPMIDPFRRKWPSGRTEIWAPLEITVQVPMTQKGSHQ